jgi:predicted MFS family arabinose efflux permease
MQTPDPAARAPGASHSMPGAYRALAILLAIFVINHADRQLLVILMEPMRHELGLSDADIGFLTGFAFALFYAIAGVPLARLADTSSRRAIIAWGLAAWSVATAVQAAVANFWQLAVARVSVGVGEATTSPSAHSLIADLFAPARRATALAVFTLGGHLGMWLGMALGGILLEQMPWRMAFLVVGGPGILLALLVTRVLPEPPRGQSEGRVDPGEVPQIREVARYLFAQPTFVLVCLATSLYVLASFGFNIWGPQLLQRVHGIGSGELGMSFGAVSGIAGALGTLLGGNWVDRWISRDPRWALFIPALGGVLMIPFALGFLFADSASAAIWIYAPQVFVGTFYLAPAYSVVQSLAGLRMRAQASALILVLINVLGLGIGPWCVGLLSDALRETRGELGLRDAMLALPLASLLGAALSILAARTLRADLARSRERG